MPARKRDPVKADTKRRKPAMTPEERENQLIAKAMDLVERRIEEGTATSQETTDFLKLGSSRERLEQQRLAYDAELAQAKVDAIASQQRMEELYGDALAAFTRYQGRDDIELEYDDEYDDED